MTQTDPESIVTGVQSGIGESGETASRSGSSGCGESTGGAVSTGDDRHEGLSAEICTVGTELLLGQTVDTNSAYIAQQLAKVGVNVYYRSGVGDNLARIEAVMRLALSRADVLVLTGGLGPTQDDLTAEALSHVFDVSMELHAETDARIRERVARLRLQIAESSYRMAMVPRGAVVMANEVGAAPGLWLEKAGKIAIALPGVPSEMKDLVDREVVPRLRTLTARSPALIRSRVLRLVGIAESLAEEKILDLIQDQGNPTLAPYAGAGEVKVRITARAPDESTAVAMIEETEARVRERLGPFIYGADEETLDRVVGRLLIERGLTIATAESCTAGLLAAALTEMPGSSAYLMAGAVTYSNEAKERTLGVPAAAIEQFGAVSAETAEAMARGIRRVYETDLGISVTGIAGPGGGSAEKPVGLVYFGLASGNAVTTERRLFHGSRSDIRRRSVTAALQMIYRRITI
jgi:nicotinamide-nucleotide amidase